jgi:hypothetical protein
MQRTGVGGSIWPIAAASVDDPVLPASCKLGSKPENLPPLVGLPPEVAGLSSLRAAWAWGFSMGARAARPEGAGPGPMLEG